MAISIERIHYIDVAQKTTVQMESELFTQFAAVDHFPRSAHTAGLAGRTGRYRPVDCCCSTDEQRELVLSMRNSAMRMAALVNSLLDMARLESGAVQLNLQWQPLEEVVGSAIAHRASLLKDEH